MKRGLISFLAAVVLSGCALTAPVEERPDASAQSTAGGQLRPLARPAALNTSVSAPSPAARTVEEFDTTTAEQRSEAASATEEPEADLGLTVASLGSPSEPGFWLKTPLVTSPAKGRVVYPATGKSVAVELIPIDGPKTAGSRMSLPAMRLIEAPLTELPQVRVFRVSG